jgi:hypothetical protein
MKKSVGLYVAAIMMFVCLFAWSHALAISPPKKGGTFPDITFPVPKDAGHREYLGLPESGNFKVPQIKADVVIIEVFNMY